MTHIVQQEVSLSVTLYFSGVLAPLRIALFFKVCKSLLEFEMSAAPEFEMSVS